MARAPRSVFTIDDAMRAFANETSAPPGDYRIIEKNKPNKQRAYVVQRIQQVAGFATGTTPSGKKREPRQAQRIVAEGVKEPRSVTAPRWARIQAGAQFSATLQTLSTDGTLVDLRAHIVIGDDDRAPRLIKGVEISPLRLNWETGVPWEQFIEAWGNGNLVDATAYWTEAYAAALDVPYPVMIDDVQTLVMRTIATAQERTEAA